MFPSSSPTERPDVFVCQWTVMIMLYLLDKYIIHCTGNACIHTYIHYADGAHSMLHSCCLYCDICQQPCVLISFVLIEK